MQTFDQLERQRVAAERKRLEQDENTVRCPKCGSEWFEDLVLGRYRTDYSIIVGQQPATRVDNVPFHFLRCAHCQEIIEPQVIRNSRDLASKAYDECLDTLEGKKDKREPTAQEDLPSTPPKGKK